MSALTLIFNRLGPINSNDMARRMLDEYQTHLAIERRKKAVTRQNMYEDHWTQELDVALRNCFADENYRNMQVDMDTSLNVLKRVIDRTALVYSNPAKYKLSDDEAGSEALVALHESYDHNGLMRYVNKMLRLHGALLLRPVVRDEMPCVDVLLPSFTEVSTSQTNGHKITSMIYQIASESMAIGQGDQLVKAKAMKYYCYMDAERIVFMDGNGDRIADPNNPEEKNPYGMITATLAHMGKADGIWCDYAANDLVECNLSVGILNTYRQNAVKTSAYKQIYIQCPQDKSVPSDQIRDSVSPLILPEGTAGLLDMQINLQQITDVISKKVEEVCTGWGISASEFSLTSQAQSGWARKIANLQLEHEVNAQRAAMRRVEQDLLDMQRVVYGVHGVANIPEDAKLVVDFAELDWGEDPPQVQYATKKEMVADGLLTWCDLYREFVNPDGGDDAEVLAVLKANKATNRDAKRIASEEGGLPTLGLTGG